MSVKDLIEAARFPVYKTGGYECASVDALLLEVMKASTITERELQSAHNETAGERRRRDSLERELAHARQSAEDAKRRLTVVEAELRDIRDNEGAHAERAIAMAAQRESEKVAELERKNADLFSQVQALKSALTDARLELDTDTHQTTECRAALEESKTREARLRTENGQFKEQIRQLRAALESARAQLTALSAKAAPTPTPPPAAPPVATPPVTPQATPPFTGMTRPEEDQPSQRPQRPRLRRGG